MAKVLKPIDVFISYARVDEPKVKAIVKSLTASGLIEKDDRILREGDLPVRHRAVREEIKRRIQSASIVVVVWGPASANSQWVNYEIGLADALGKRIVVVIPKEGTVALPSNLQNVQIVKLGSAGRDSTAT